MKTATSLTVIAIGAILAFAVTASPGFLSLPVVGWILMATGGVGLLLTPRSQDWLRRRVIIRRTTGVRPTRRSAPQLAAADPATRPMQQPRPASPDDGEGETIEEYVEQ